MSCADLIKNIAIFCNDDFFFTYNHLLLDSIRELDDHLGIVSSKTLWLYILLEVFF